MRAIINLLHTNNGTFLREPISDSAYALDKARFLSLTNKTIVVDTTDLRVRVSIDAEKRVIPIDDVGMMRTRRSSPSTLGRSQSAGRPSSCQA